jgi:hypothetical protein
VFHFRVGLAHVSCFSPEPSGKYLDAFVDQVSPPSNEYNRGGALFGLAAARIVSILIFGRTVLDDRRNPLIIGPIRLGDVGAAGD